jgi:hypothetical protein
VQAKATNNPVLQGGRAYLFMPHMKPHKQH